LCHADQGQPARIAVSEPAIEPELTPAPPVASQEPEKPRLSSLKRKKMEREAAARRRQAQPRLERYPAAAVGHKIEVRVDALEPVVMAAVLTPGPAIAVRTWG
jgi:hypothetical protein